TRSPPNRRRAVIQWGPPRLQRPAARPRLARARSAWAPEPPAVRRPAPPPASPRAPSAAPRRRAAADRFPAAAPAPRRPAARARRPPAHARPAARRTAAQPPRLRGRKSLIPSFASPARAHAHRHWWYRMDDWIGEPSQERLARRTLRLATRRTEPDP